MNSMIVEELKRARNKLAQGTGTDLLIGDDGKPFMRKEMQWHCWAYLEPHALKDLRINGVVTKELCLKIYDKAIACAEKA